MPKQAKIRILLIDDDPDVHTVVRQILEPKSYQVLSAYDGSEGLRSVVEERPDLIILDVVMPGKHGFDVCHELKTDEKYHFFSHIPVLMLTVYPEERDKIHLSIRDGMMMEAEDYLQKPVDPPELLRRIEALLRK